MGLKIKLYRSIAGSSEDQLRTIQGLGLRKFGDERLLKDTASIRGMIFKVKHLVSHEVVTQEPPPSKRMKPRKIRARDASRARASKEAQS
jgi:large subunit ribosomal protein L30